MPGDGFSDARLLAYLDEQLPVEEMSAVEKALRESEALRSRAAGLMRRRDQGAHSVGEVWRRMRLSCPARAELGGFLLGTLAPPQSRYVDFHLRTVGCRFCAANVVDLEKSLAAHPEASERRRKFFQSSAGYLPKDGG